LLHRPDDLLGIQGKTLLAVLMHIKKIGLVKKIGVSIYSPDQLPALMDVHSFDIVQTPANILDQRIVHSGWANQLFKSGVEVHVRSVFLQGLLLMPNEARPEKFHIWHPVWNEWSRWLNASGMSAVEACLSYCLSHSTFNRVLVGVDSVEQLQQIIKVNNKPLSSLPNWPPFDQRLLNPALWNTI
jgi:aryl-alcohol dehydrogenase-like predicted oxidoreductase